MKINQLCARVLRQHGLKSVRKAITLSLFCFVAFLFLVFINNHYVRHLKWYERPAPCVMPKLIVDNLLELTLAVSKLLTELNVSHSLCYGTLLGALRYGKTLPWDNNVDFCVMKTEIEKVPKTLLMEHFKNNKMELVYNHFQGEYVINRGRLQAVLTVFYESSPDVATKDGITNRFLWFLQGADLVTFPSSLLKAPLKTIVFHGQSMPVPHSDAEILKYFYPNDWWMEKSPPGCDFGHTPFSSNKQESASGS